MPNDFGGSVWEELSANSPTMTPSVTARLWPRARVTHPQHHSHSSPTAHAPEGVNHTGKDHFTVSAAGSSIQKQPHWAASALPEAGQSCSCPAWGSQRRRSEEWVMKEGKEG